MPRLEPPDPATYTAKQRRVHDTIASGPRGRVRGPLAIWLHRPELAEAAQALGGYCRYGASLPPRLSSLAVLTLARLWGAEFQWHAYKPQALKAGLDPAVIESLRTGGTPDFADPAEAIVNRVISELGTTHRVSDATYAEALELLGDGGLVDLVGLAGYATLIAMTVNAFEVPLPEGEAEELTR
jgi:4-carboxymuconolactone decarboxylase